MKSISESADRIGINGPGRMGERSGWAAYIAKSRLAIRIVHTELFDEPFNQREAIVTTVVEKDGKTTMTVTVLAPSRKIRDAVLKSGMTKGAAMSYDRLAGLVESAS